MCLPILALVPTYCSILRVVYKLFKCLLPPMAKQLLRLHIQCPTKGPDSYIVEAALNFHIAHVWTGVEQGLQDRK